MPDEITDAMTEAALKEWHRDRLKYCSDVGDWTRMQRTLAAALDAAPSGHGERG